MGVNNCIDCDKKKAAIDCNCIPVENSDGTLQDIVLGCTDSTSCNYDALANCDDGSCEEKNPGCMDPSSLNYSSCFNADCAGNCPGTAGYIEGGTYGNDSCCCDTAGCTDATADNYNSSACIDDGSCEYTGCMDNAACNYDSLANVACSGCCTYPPTASVTETNCDNYYWALDGNTYTTSGTYTHSDGASCPTTTTLNLTINNATTGSSTQDVCNSYTWSGPLGDGTTYSADGTYTNTTTNAAGCTHTETLYLTIKPNGCTDATAVNYDPAAECDTGCIAAVGGCTYGGAVLPSWNGTALGVSDSYAQVYPGQADPGAAASNYNAGANVENGSCNFAVPGCMDPTACNYDPNATTDDGSCVTPTSQDLGEANYGKETPNCVKPDGAHQKGCSSSFQFGCDNAYNYGANNYGISAYPFEAGEPVFGAHCTDNIGSSYMEMPNYDSNDGSNNDQKVYAETYFFMATNLTIGNTVCITWAEIVLALRHNGSCSDCLTGGWWVKIDTGTGSPGWTAINDATSLYNPITGTVSHGTSPGGLSTANALYHNSLCETNDVGNGNGVNTAGAPNGSYSTWDTKCITFVATATTHRIHFISITDFDICTTCNWKPANNEHGSYMGISKVQISSDGCTGNCSC